MANKLNEKILIEGFVGKDSEERNSNTGQPYASFPLIVNQYSDSTGNEVKTTYNICAKGQLCEFVLGKKNPATKVRTGDRVLVFGDLRTSVNKDLVMPYLRNARSALAEGNIPSAFSLIDQVESIFSKEHSSGRNVRPLLFRNVFIGGGSDFIEVVSRKSRTRLHDAIRESGVRELFGEMSDTQFDNLVVQTMLALAEQPNVTSGIPNGTKVADASVLIEQSPREKNMSKIMQYIRESPDFRLAGDFKLDDLPI